MTKHNNNEKIHLFLWFLLWYAATHYFQFSFGGSGLEIPSSNMVWIATILFIASCFYTIIQNEIIIITKTTIFSAVVILVLMIPYSYLPSWFSQQQLFSNSYGRACGLFAGLFFLTAITQIPKTTKTVKLFCTTILLGIFIEAIFVLVQYYLLTEQNWVNYDINYRPYGIFQQVNVAATFIAVGCPLALFILHTTNLVAGNKWATYFILFITLTCALAVGLIQSRAGYLGLGLSCIFGFLGSFRAYKNQRKTRIAWLITIIIGVLLAATSLYWVDNIARDLDQITSGASRVSIYRRCVEMFFEHPFAGWGYGNFKWAFLQHQAAAYASDSSTILGPDNLGHPHNELLLWAVEGGILPLIAILFFVFFYLRQLFKQKNGLLFFSLLIPIVVSCLVELPFYNAAILWILFLFLIWLGDDTKQYSIPIRQTFALRVLTPLLATLTVLFMLTNLYSIYLLTKYKQTGNATLFAKVLNPIGISESLTINTMYMRYSLALQTGNREELNYYLIWLKDFMPYEPLFVLYESWVNALLALGQEDYAESIKDENNYLFPKQQMHIENGQVITDTESNQ